MATSPEDTQPHWSQQAQHDANASMGSGEPGAAVQPCPEEDWEPFAEIDAVPDWGPYASVEDVPDWVPVASAEDVPDWTPASAIEPSGASTIAED